MLTLIAAVAVAAAAPANAPANPPAPDAPIIGAGSEQHGQMADMENCRGKDMMSKMHETHRTGHAGHSAQ